MTTRQAPARWWCGCTAACGCCQPSANELTEDEGAEDIQQALDWDFKNIEAEEDDREEALLHTTWH